MVQPAWPIHFLVRKVSVTLTVSCDLQQAQVSGWSLTVRKHVWNPTVLSTVHTVSGWSLTWRGTLLCLVLCPADFSS